MQQRAADAWEGPSKAFYDGFVKGAKGPLDYGPWFYSFCTSLSWRVLTFLRRIGDKREILDNPHIADALESWRLFMMTADPGHIGGHSQHLFLADPRTARSCLELPRLFVSSTWFISRPKRTDDFSTLLKRWWVPIRRLRYIALLRPRAGFVRQAGPTTFSP